VSVERWGWYSVGLNVLLAALHGAIAAASGSLAVTAELVHNLVDFAAAVAVLAASSSPPASRRTSPTACTSWRTWRRSGSLC
jgi:divalent metal cation (Fe/Co/Zn/Cd) transporter